MDPRLQQLGWRHRALYPRRLLPDRNCLHRLSDRAGLPIRSLPLPHSARSPPFTPAPTGEDKSYPKRIFLIYDGIHYDCIVERTPPPTPAAPAAPAASEERRIFDSADEEALEGATAVGAAANRARQFTDLSAFALRCLVCGQGLKGAADAQAHAAATGHTNFAEK